MNVVRIDNLRGQLRRCLHRKLEESALNGVCIDNLRSQLWTMFIQFVLTTWGVSCEPCLYWQLEESTMIGVCIDKLRSQLWMVFVWTTWGVSYERCFYGQLDEPAMNGVCMNKPSPSPTDKITTCGSSVQLCWSSSGSHHQYQVTNKERKEKGHDLY
jgi:hypothetical protein